MSQDERRRKMHEATCELRDIVKDGATIEDVSGFIEEMLSADARLIDEPDARLRRDAIEVTNHPDGRLVGYRLLALLEDREDGTMSFISTELGNRLVLAGATAELDVVNAMQSALSVEVEHRDL